MIFGRASNYKTMEENIIQVFHGFLNLTAKEKLLLIEEINNYFDSNNREPIRETHESRFKEIDWNAPERKCKCCGK
jgi:hypothetical protein